MAESAEEKRKREQWEKEREYDEEKRRDAGLTTPELKKYQPTSEPVIDEAKSTHEPEQPKITESAATHQAQHPKKPSRFDNIRKRFEEKGEELRENFSRGARQSLEDVKEDASREVRKKLNRLTPEQTKDELKRLKDQIALERARKQLQQTRQKIRSANATANQNVFASNEGEFFGMNMSGLNPEQFFGFGVSGNSQPDIGFGGGFDMETWKQMTSYGSNKKNPKMSDMGMGMDFSNFDLGEYNKTFNSWMGGGSVKKNTKSAWNGNVMDIFGGGKKAKGLTLDDVRKFYAMG